jgi:hypothetical protein
MNLKYNQAIEADIAQNLQLAASLYEEVLKLPDPPLAAFINLACLCWLAGNEPILNPVDHNFFMYAGTRALTALDEAEARFGPQVEILFWRKYYAYISWGGDSFLDECLQWIEQAPDCLPLYFYAYIDIDTKREEYRPQLQQLYHAALAQRTTKNNYILSMIE